MQLTPHANKYPVVKDPIRFAHLVKRSFSQRRKTLRNNLSELLQADELVELDIDPSRRAETLSIEDYIRIANYLSDR